MRSLVRVPHYSDSAPGFLDGRVECRGNKSDRRLVSIEINPYNAEAKIFDVWSGPLVSVQPSELVRDNG